MTKRLFVWAVAALLMAGMGCRKDDEPDNNSNNHESGLYVGVVGFNQDLTQKDISVLTETTKNGFINFIDRLTTQNGTLLYYSVDNAMDMLSSASLPDDVIKVAIVTFTDGLDQGSIMMNSHYQTNTEYLNAINNRIRNVRIQGKEISAYSIGLKGNDVVDETQFRENLDKLSNAGGGNFLAGNMDEVNARFQEIAEQLNSASTNQTLNLTIPGQSNGTKIRFTFDNVADASFSTLYIEGVIAVSGQNYTLNNIKYNGLTAENGNSVKGTQNGIFLTFSFINLQQSTGLAAVPVSADKVQQWSYIASSGQWQRNSEFTPENNTETTIERRSAVIMLVLDCSSSLGNDFKELKNNAKEFVEKLVKESTWNGNSNSNSGVNPIQQLLADLVYVEGGTFFMGAQNSDPNGANYDTNAYSDEFPVHEVTLDSYYIGRYEVTQGLWEYVMNYSGRVSDGTTLSAVGPYFGYYEQPSAYHGLGDDYPVYCVSYNDIVNYFLPRLNKITGKNFRLPTEAEWEYAARGGQKDEYTRTRGQSGTYYKYAGSNDIDEVAWYYDNSGDKNHPVGLKAPNALGLYDMTGNVQEWCSDWYGNYTGSPADNPTGPATGSNRVFRGGGSGDFYARLSRLSYRNDFYSLPDARSYDLGLRLVLPL